MFNPRNIFDWKDRQHQSPKGYLTFRLYQDGWLVRFTPYDQNSAPQKLEGADVWTACRWANERNG